MAENVDLDPRVAAALEVIEQALQDLRAANDGHHGETATADAEMALLRDELEQLLILAGGSDG